MVNIDNLESLAKAATPGPWTSCNNTACKCRTISCDDHPIAEITKAVAYMDQITYGHIPVDQAMANKAYIVGTNPSIVLELIEEIKKLRNEVSKNENIMSSAIVVNYQAYYNAVLREVQKLDSTINSLVGDLTMNFSTNKTPAKVAKELCN